MSDDIQILRDWLSGCAIVIDDDSDPKKIVFTPFVIEGVVWLGDDDNGRGYVLLKHWISGTKSVRSLDSALRNETIFPTLEAAAHFAAAEQIIEDAEAAKRPADDGKEGEIEF